MTKHQYTQLRKANQPVMPAFYEASRHRNGEAVRQIFLCALCLVLGVAITLFIIQPNQQADPIAPVNSRGGTFSTGEK
jgi:hypothetical protein